MLENTANLYASNLAMEKQFLEMDMDPTTLVCVNPYDVNPVIIERDTQPVTASAGVSLKDESSVTPPQPWDTSYGGEFYGCQKRIKLEMEQFGDLSSYLSKPMSTNSIDELNTPIFDKDAFDFNVNDYPKRSQSEDIFVKLESDAICENTCIITDNIQFKNFTQSTGKVHQNGYTNSDISNMLQNPDINVFSPQSENESAYSCSNTPPFQHTTVFNVDDTSALSDNRQFSNVKNMDANFVQFNNGLETPEDSNSCQSTGSIKRPTHLSLNVNLKSNFDSNLATPSIVEEVVDLENANFNILDLVTSEDITFVNAEDIFSTPAAVNSNTTVNSIKYKESIPQKRPRKRRTYTNDDDEDYVPPTKKNVVYRKNIVIDESDESDFEESTDIDFKPKRSRGRPPKRTESFSSDCSKEGDASKYRELRDKNNEASRKSRLKRKVKELELEKEADDLLCKNIKLKAQVEELEKMVTNFRDNLFKIMIKK